MSVHEAGWPHFSVVNPSAEIELEKNKSQTMILES